MRLCLETGALGEGYVKITLSCVRMKIPKFFGRKLWKIIFVKEINEEGYRKIRENI